MTSETLLLILFGYLLAAFLLAIVYLFQRKLSLGESISWGLLALLIPALGPFLVILSQPKPRSRRRRQAPRQ